MVDFIFERRTKLIFGEKKVETIRQHLPPNAKILLVYGGGSIKKNGIYDRLIAALAPFKVVEFPGIEPNPSYDMCLKAIDIVRKEQLNFVLAVGGGSVMDAGKFIALSANYKGEPWDLVSPNPPYVVPLDVAVISTLPATGSEMNGNYVISNHALKIKTGGKTPIIAPLFAIMEPSVTLGLSWRQTSNGVADAYIHVMEQYCTIDQGTFLQDRWAEGILATLLESGKALIKDDQDIDARRAVMHAAAMALNGYIQMGVGVMDWSVHAIGHELTILYGVDHGRSLTTVLPTLLRVQRDIKRDKLIMYGRNVFKLTEPDEEKLITQTIDATEEFFKSLKMPTKLSELEGVPSDVATVVSERFAAKNAKIGQQGSVDAAVIKEVLTKAY